MLDYIILVTTAAALTCWETPRSSNDEYMNRRSDELVITEKECSSSAKSCMSKGYDFRGKMQCKMRGDAEFGAQESKRNAKPVFFQTYSWDVATWTSRSATAP